MPLTKTDVARLRGLREKRAREAAGLFVVEGPKVVGELLAAGHAFAALYATEAWRPPGAVLFATGPEAESPNAGRGPGASGRTEARPVVVRVTAEEMARISHFPTPSSVLAVGRIARTVLAPGELDRGFTLALDGIQDPGNVGTLLRIADWFGFDRVVLSPDCADLFSQKVINASMGSFARVRVATTPLAPVLAAATVPVLGCDLEGENVHALAPPAAAIVVIGSEGRGLSPEVAAGVSQRITIPRHGAAESLNAAVAAGIVCALLRR